MDARCLSMHAGYRCRNSGICCEMGWPIPVAEAHAAVLTAHFGGRRGQLLARPATPLAGAGASTRLALAGDGACICYDRAGRSCAIHGELGEAALPSPCRNFPRVVLRDGRGLSVTLSHFCPTAADSLFDGPPLAIVPAPDALTLGGQAEGLDALDVLPPLLRPGMLMDLDAYDRWEHAAVATLADESLPPLDALRQIAAATATLARWQPGARPLAACVEDAFASASGQRAGPPDPELDARAHALVLDAVPAGVDRPTPVRWSADRGAQVLDVWDEHERAVRCYLAARLFASWYAYDAAGVGSVVAATILAGAVLRAELARRLDAARPPTRELMTGAVRAADLLLVHLADHRRLAPALATAASSQESTV